jgi:hypothetical protein
MRVPAHYATIQQGINAAQAGDTILVAPGVYRGSIRMPNRQLVLTSEGGRDVTTVWGPETSANTIYIQNGCPAGTEICGFTIRGTTGRAIDISYGSLTIRSNRICGDAPATGRCRSGIYLFRCTGTVITDNVFVNTCGDLAHGISALFIGHYCSDILLSHNLFYNNTGGTTVHAGYAVGGIVIANNTIIGSAMASHIEASVHGDNIRNNIIVNDIGYCVSSDGGSDVAVEYNCTFGTHEPFNFTPGTGNFVADPAFVDALRAGFYLAPGSPCVDAGDPDPVYHDGDGSRNDIGAFPYTDGCYDIDADGSCFAADNCPFTANSGQLDGDGDLWGDDCDNCPVEHNPGQEDADEDGQGDACSTDSDGDGIDDVSDNCPSVSNVTQLDGDGDGVGNVCDNCPNLYNPDQSNRDGDAHGDACDNCPDYAHYWTDDRDSDGIGDACDGCTDTDGDGYGPSGPGFVGMPCGDDNCPELYNPDQANSDGDSYGDACDNCPDLASPVTRDVDNDGLGDPCDPDDDNDGIADSVDNCHFAYNPDQLDSDSDGVGDACRDWGCCEYLGNVDGSLDGLVTMGDLTVMIDHLFVNLTPLVCPAEGNVDLSIDFRVTMSDLTVLIYHLFIGLSPLPSCSDLPGYPIPSGVTDSVGCKLFEKDVDTTSSWGCIEWAYYPAEQKLVMTHVNAGFNCCPVIGADFFIGHDSIKIVESDSLYEGGCDCECLFDVEYTLWNIGIREYHVIIVEPLAGVPDEPFDFYMDLASQPQGVFCLPRTTYPWGE